MSTRTTPPGGGHTADSETIREYVEAGGYEVVWTVDCAEPERGKQPSIVPRDKEPILAALARLEAAANRTASAEASHAETMQKHHRDLIALKAAEAERDEKHRQLEDMHTWGSEWKARAYAAEAERDAALNALEWKNVDQMRELATAEAERDAALAALREIAFLVGDDTTTYLARRNISVIARAVLGGPQ